MSFALFSYLAVALLGLILGSFLNVVIHRLPRGESVVRPGSRCPSCESPIRWYQNVPVVSYLVLRGRCARCRTPISPRYLATEVVTALCLVWLLQRFGLGQGFLVHAPLACALVALFFIDLEHKLLPDAITIPGTLLGLAVSPWNQHLSWRDSVVGAVLGFGSLWLLAALYEKIRGVAGLGGGDIKMAAMIGAYTGPKGLVEVLLLASVAGLAVGLSLIAVGRGNLQTELPFGCFLAPATLLVGVLGAETLWILWWQGGAPLLVRYLYG